MRNIALGILALVATAPSFARELTVVEKLTDLDQLVSLVKAGYGPLHYKAEHVRLDIDELRDSYADRILATKTNSDFYYTLAQFVPEFHDSHFGAFIPTTRMASVPFLTDLVDGKVLIDTIDRAKLSEKDFPFARGDEVVEIDGKPVSDAIAQLQKFANAGFEQTARRVSTMRLTSRSGARVPLPTASDVTFKIRHGSSEIFDTVKLSWRFSGENFDENRAMDLFAPLVAERPGMSFDELSIFDDYSDLPQSEQSFRCSGNTRTAIPADATIIMMSPFVAYYHATAKGNVGYLRIPHYSPKNEVTQAEEYQLRFKQYEYAVSVLEKNTVGLIIDQDHNCGGSIEWLNSIVGLFMDKAYEPLQFQLLATKEQYLSFSKWLKELDEHTLEYQELATTRDLIRSSWEKGEFMTPMTSIDGDRALRPNRIRYTHPIVMTIDELSGSGGDAFPALMQGYGRAKLLGTRTMGAGGHVEEQPPLYYSQLSVRMTKSLFYRPDGVAVENNGAMPDYPYTITRDDFMYGYRGYQAYYLQKLAELLP